MFAIVTHLTDIALRITLAVSIIAHNVLHWLSIPYKQSLKCVPLCFPQESSSEYQWGLCRHIFIQWIALCSAPATEIIVSDGFFDLKRRRSHTDRRKIGRIQYGSWHLSVQRKTHSRSIRAGVPPPVPASGWSVLRLLSDTGTGDT